MGYIWLILSSSTRRLCLKYLLGKTFFSGSSLGCRLIDIPVLFGWSVDFTQYQPLLGYSMPMSLMLNYIQYKNVSCQPLMSYFMPKSVWQLWSSIIYSTKMYHVNPCWVILCQNQCDNYGTKMHLYNNLKQVNIPFEINNSKLKDIKFWDS